MLQEGRSELKLDPRPDIESCIQKLGIKIKENRIYILFRFLTLFVLSFILFYYFYEI